MKEKLFSALKNMYTEAKQYWPKHECFQRQQWACAWHLQCLCGCRRDTLINMAGLVKAVIVMSSRFHSLNRACHILSLLIDLSQHGHQKHDFSCYQANSLFLPWAHLKFFYLLRDWAQPAHTAPFSVQVTGHFFLPLYILSVKHFNSVALLNKYFNSFWLSSSVYHV